MLQTLCLFSSVSVTVLRDRNRAALTHDYACMLSLVRCVQAHDDVDHPVLPSNSDKHVQLGRCVLRDRRLAVCHFVFVSILVAAVHSCAMAFGPAIWVENGVREVVYKSGRLSYAIRWINKCMSIDTYICS